MMESLGASYAPKMRAPMQLQPQAQGRYNMKPIGAGTLRPTLPVIGGGLGQGGPRGGGGMVQPPRGGSLPWGQSGPGQGGMIPRPGPNVPPPNMNQLTGGGKQPRGGSGFAPGEPYPRNGGGGIMNPRPTKGGMSGGWSAGPKPLPMPTIPMKGGGKGVGGFQPLGSGGHTMKGPMRGRKF